MLSTEKIIHFFKLQIKTLPTGSCRPATQEFAAQTTELYVLHNYLMIYGIYFIILLPNRHFAFIVKRTKTKYKENDDS